MERRAAFTFRTPTSIMIAGPSGLPQDSYSRTRTCLALHQIPYIIATVHGSMVLKFLKNVASNFTKVCQTEIFYENGFLKEVF